MSNGDPIVFKSKLDYVYELLKKRIVTGELDTEAELVIAKVAEELGVSQTPVREALKRLEAEALIVISPNGKAKVAPISLQDLTDLHMVRSALEGLAAELAAVNLTEGEINRLGDLAVEIRGLLLNNNLDRYDQLNQEFHNIIVTAAHNEVLLQTYSDIMLKRARYRIGTYRIHNLSQVLADEHDTIVTALRNRNSQEARQLAEHHIKRSLNDLLKYYHGNFSERGEKN